MSLALNFKVQSQSTFIAWFVVDVKIRLDEKKLQHLYQIFRVNLWNEFCMAIGNQTWTNF